MYCIMLIGHFDKNADQALCFVPCSVIVWPKDHLK